MKTKAIAIAAILSLSSCAYHNPETGKLCIGLSYDDCANSFGWNGRRPNPASAQLLMNYMAIQQGDIWQTNSAINHALGNVVQPVIPYQPINPGTCLNLLGCSNLVTPYGE